MLVNLMAVVVLVLSVEAKTYTKCSDLPSLSLNYAEYVLASPLKLLRSTNTAYNCSLAVVTGPAGLGGNTNYTYIFIQGNKVLGANSVMGSVASNPEYDCHDGAEAVYKHVAINLTSANPYVINYGCNGDAVTQVGAFGRDETVIPIIDEIIAKYFSGFSGVVSAVKTVWTTASCNATPYCGGFFN